MVIDGRTLADGIIESLKRNVAALKQSGITPTLAVILVGDDPGSIAYIRQKQRAAVRIGAKLILEQFPESVTPDILEKAILRNNADKTIHGLIVQRPIPTFVGEVGDIVSRVAPEKDVDGFVPHSPFIVPVSEAVLTILEHIHGQLQKAGLVPNDFKTWLNNQKLAVVGRGETAGKPIAATLKKYDCATSIIHSKTSNPEKILKTATVIISCVGKPHIITKKQIKPGVILLSVGLSQDKNGKLQGDYDDEKIKHIAAFYTPTPGGVGPVNIACLMRNLVNASELASS
jgi:methylenetetrahydrofolate dehydrogenase (NADP+) / methenyltetrahydrofolate cyclohydrolase